MSATAHRDRVESLLARIAEQDHVLGAMITTTAEQARAAADRCDAAEARGDWLGPLHGVVVSLKDNTDLAGVATTHGCELFRHNVPSVDSEVVRRIVGAGAIVIGKNNLNEISFGATTQNRVFGPCRNPWDVSRIPGGSSGGSAVAVVAGLADVAIGTDSGGSGRIPAALTGVSGLRPTFGRISCRGVSAASASLAVVAPIARRVSELARLFGVLDGYDPADPLCTPGERPEILNQLRHGVTGLRIGVPRNHFFAGVDSQVEALVWQAIDVFADLGATIVPIDLPEAEAAQRQQGMLLLTDAAAHHQVRLRDTPDGFSADVRQRLQLGVDTSGVDYANAVQWRNRWIRRVRSIFQQVDVIASPTVLSTAPRIEDCDLIATSQLLGRLVAPWSMAGIPAMSVPCGFDERTLPVGLQLAADANAEALLFRAGSAYQEVTEWHRSVPPTIDADAVLSTARRSEESKR